MACSFITGDLVAHNCLPFSSVNCKMDSSSGNKYKRNHLLIVSRKNFLRENALLLKGARVKRKADTQGQTQKCLPLEPGIVQPRLPVPDHILKPPYVYSKSLPALGNEPQIHDAKGIECMRASCRLAAQVLEYAGTLVKPSVTTDEIDKAVHKMIIEAGAYPSPLGYGGFPKSVCTSVNECLCHGIPDSRPLQDGDIINIDVTVYLNGYHGDTSKTFLCGNVDNAAKKLVKITEDCMYKAISVCKAGVSFNKIGSKIDRHAEKFGYTVDRRFVGHGVGKIFHSEPVIFHYRNRKPSYVVAGNRRPGYMVPGQTFTIEPILVLGSTDCIVWNDNWTTVTADGSLAAQFEHTILITRSGAEILTRC